MKCIPLVLSLMIAPTLAIVANAAQKGTLVYAGTYTSGGKSKGIYAYRMDSEGKLTPLGVAAETTNPSFLAIHPNGRVLYAVGEVGGPQGGTLSAFSIDRNSGKLTLLNRVPTKGGGPCYVSTDSSGKVALVANYGGGSVASFPLDAEGRPGEAASFIQHEGSSINPKRQEKPHAHSIMPSPDNRFAIAADLGIDKLMIYRLDAAKATLTINDPPAAELEPGSGPRHFAFHPKGGVVYVINELKSTMTVFAYDRSRGALRSLQTVSTLPGPFAADNWTAEVLVHPSGRFVYGSNRGHDSIAVFSADGKGMLKLVEATPTQGKTPRNFRIDPTGRFLLAANQGSDSIVVFKIDSKTGRLTPAGQAVEVPSPVCVKFLAE